MAKIKFTPDDGYDRTVTVGFQVRSVVPDQVIEVPVEDVYGFTCQSIWEPVDAEAKKAHKDAVAEIEKAATGGDESAPVAEEE